jgi:hypothetical protein
LPSDAPRGRVVAPDRPDRGLLGRAAGRHTATPASTSTPATPGRAHQAAGQAHDARGRAGRLGGFGALFEVPKRYREPVLVSGTDGVGTKLKLAFAAGTATTRSASTWSAMSVNDVLVQGAEPLFFLDYFACGKLTWTPRRRGRRHRQGLRAAGCALIGGETAEMPGMYPPTANTTWPASPSARSKSRASSTAARHRAGRRGARHRLQRRALQRLFAGPQDLSSAPGNPIWRDLRRRRRDAGRRADGPPAST